MNLKLFTCVFVFNIAKCCEEIFHPISGGVGVGLFLADSYSGLKTNRPYYVGLVVCLFHGAVKGRAVGDFSISSNPFQIHLNFFFKHKEGIWFSFDSCMSIVASASFFQISGDWPMNAWAISRPVLC